MKKIISLLIAISLFTLSFASCGNNEVITPEEDEQYIVTKTALVLVEKGSTYSNEAATDFRVTFKKGEGTVTTVEFDPKTDDMNTILKQAVDTKVGVVFAPTSADAAIKIVQAANALDLQCPILVGNKWKTSAVNLELQPSHLKVFAVDFFASSNDINDPTYAFAVDFRNFIKENKEVYELNDSSTSFTSVSAVAYDSYNLMCEAISKAGSAKGEALTSTDIAAALIDIEYEGVTGKIKFDGRGMAVKDGAFVTEYKNGVYGYEKYQTAAAMTNVVKPYKYADDKSPVKLDTVNKKIKVAVFEPFSSDMKKGGNAEYIGFLFAQNRTPKIKIGSTDYTVELVRYNNESKEDKAKQTAEKIVKNKPVFVLGSYGNGLALAGAETLTNAKIPSIAPTVTNTALVSNAYSFSGSFKDAFQGSVMAYFALSLVK